MNISFQFFCATNCSAEIRLVCPGGAGPNTEHWSRWWEEKGLVVDTVWRVKYIAKMLKVLRTELKSKAVKLCFLALYKTIQQYGLVRSTWPVELWRGIPPHPPGEGVKLEMRWLTQNIGVDDERERMEDVDTVWSCDVMHWWNESGQVVLDKAAGLGTVGQMNDT